MKIVTWSEEILTGYHWNCPDWVKEALQTGVASAYCMLDEEHAETAAWIAFYIEGRKVEIIACGQETEDVNHYPLERLFVRLWQFCQENQIFMVEAEQIGTVEPGIREAMRKSGMVPRNPEENFFRLQFTDGNSGVDSGYQFREIGSLSPQEKDSLIDLLIGQGVQAADLRGSLLRELSLAALKNGRVDACIFVSAYRGMFLTEQFAAQNQTAGKALWQEVQQEIRRSGLEKNVWYAGEHAYRPEYMMAETSVPAVIYMWLDQNLDLLSAEEEEMETEIRSEDVDELGPVLLGRLYPVMDLLKREHIEYQMSLNEEMQPCLLVLANSLGQEHLMKIQCIVDDISAGRFHFSVRTEFPGYQDAQKASVLCSRLNRELTDATIYWDEQGMLILQNYVSETMLKEEDSLRQLYSNWTNACRAVMLSSFTDI